MISFINHAINKFSSKRIPWVQSKLLLINIADLITHTMELKSTWNNIPLKFQIHFN